VVFQKLVARRICNSNGGNWFTAKEISLFADNAPPSWGRAYLKEMIRSGEVEKTMIGRTTYYRLKQ